MDQVAPPPIRITLDGSLDGLGVHDDLVSLVGWLRGHRDVGPYAAVGVDRRDPSATSAGHHMGAFGVVQLVVDEGFKTAGLVVAIMAWREAHKANARLALHREGLPPCPLPEPNAGPDEIDLTARRLDGEA
jgi:hypothetical protein